MYTLENWIQEDPERAKHFIYIFSYNGVEMSFDKIPKIILSAHILVDHMRFIVKIL